MTKKITRIIFTILGAILGFIIFYSIRENFLLGLGFPLVATGDVASTLLMALIFFALAPKIMNIIRRIADRVESFLGNISIVDLAVGVFGMIIGLVLAFLISQPLYRLELPLVGNTISVILSVIIFFALAYLGVKIAMKNVESISQFFSREEREKMKKIPKDLCPAKIIDTSVIIDGRIREILGAGFLEGNLVIPILVIEELQHIADSDNDLRRQKGRQALDTLNFIREEYDYRVEIDEDRYPEVGEVDSQLLKLAEKRKAKILTNDFNLEKVAKIQGIQVLNINSLANAMKPIVFPGERMNVHILKKGKERGQGVGYLEDGTMIVVEDGENLIDQTVETEVTSVLQTNAGKMIFVKVSE